LKAGRCLTACDGQQPRQHFSTGEIITEKKKGKGHWEHKSPVQAARRSKAGFIPDRESENSSGKERLSYDVGWGT